MCRKKISPKGWKGSFCLKEHNGTQTRSKGITRAHWGSFFISAKKERNDIFGAHAKVLGLTGTQKSFLGIKRAFYKCELHLVYNSAIHNLYVYPFKLCHTRSTRLSAGLQVHLPHRLNRSQNKSLGKKKTCKAKVTTKSSLQTTKHVCTTERVSEIIQ